MISVMALPNIRDLAAHLGLKTSDFLYILQEKGYSCQSSEDLVNFTASISIEKSLTEWKSIKEIKAESKATLGTLFGKARRNRIERYKRDNALREKLKSNLNVRSLRRVNGDNVGTNYLSLPERIECLESNKKQSSEFSNGKGWARIIFNKIFSSSRSGLPRGTNSQGNKYQSKDPQNKYRYDNKNGSTVYDNWNGSRILIDSDGETHMVKQAKKSSSSISTKRKSRSSTKRSTKSRSKGRTNHRRW